MTPCREWFVNGWPDLWFPELSHPASWERTAKELCAGCPVREACLEAGMDPDVLHPYSGIWGGLNARERMRLAGRKVARWAA